MTALADSPFTADLTPGAMQEFVTRDVPHLGMRIEFEFAPAGWRAANGEVRRADWRAYHLRPLGACGDCSGSGRVAGKREGTTKKCVACGATGSPKRARVPSVTTIGDTINPKDGLPPWAEARGIEGAIQAVKLGLIDIDDEASAARAVEEVRARRLGADRARDDAADRGLDVHAVLERYMRTGTAPRLADHPVEHHGYVQALTKWLIARQPEPVVVEYLVASPEDGYAGRLDLRARVDGRLVTFDAKTQERGLIFRGAHLQVGMYERGARVCGDEPADECRVVVFAANGEWREQVSVADDPAIDAALTWARHARLIDSACESANRVERDARKAVAA